MPGGFSAGENCPAASGNFAQIAVFAEEFSKNRQKQLNFPEHALHYQIVR